MHNAAVSVVGYGPLLEGFPVRRREFITLIGGAAMAGSTRVAGQEAGRVYRIGFLAGSPREEAVYAAFFDELRGFGFIEGQNLAVVPGGFRLRTEQLTEAAAALVKTAPDAIVATGPIATRGPRRQGDRIRAIFVTLHYVGYWHKADITTLLNHVRFRGTMVVIFQ
jgi:hypothetical protein